jgi:hypothetical protein
MVALTYTLTFNGEVVGKQMMSRIKSSKNVHLVIFNIVNFLSFQFLCDSLLTRIIIYTCNLILKYFVQQNK